MVHRRGGAKTILLAGILLAVVQGAAARAIIVGGSTQGWGLPPPAYPDYYDVWSKAQSLIIGDSLIFQYTSDAHDVFQVSQIEFLNCSRIPIVEPYASTSGYETYMLPRAGYYYFICTFPGDCEAGMRVNVSVTDPASPAMAPAPPPETGDTPADVPSPSSAIIAPAPVVKSPEKHKSSAGLIGGLSAGSGAVALVVGLLVLRWCKKGSFCEKQERNKVSQVDLNDSTSRPFTYRELSRYTKNFSDTELLSRGGFGDVFKGTLPSGAFIAVKRIRRNQTQGEESFLAEATSLGQIRHRNLLLLRGWCQAKEFLLLVYDFMCNGSLDEWIYRTPHSQSVDPGLPWNLRLSILAGVASALLYLHEEWKQCILHRDIKASNVLLDANFNAYLGDFGLARLVDHAVMQKTTLLAGTLGYMAPEMQFTGRASIETDVYAFGILSLEVVCGKRALGSFAVGNSTEHYVLVESVWEAHEAGDILSVTDPGLWSHCDGCNGLSRDGTDISAVGQVLELGLLCCLPSPTERPSMRFVNHWFQSGLLQDLPRLPASKPSVAPRTASWTDSSFAQDKRPAC